MSDVSQWSTTASSNNSAPPDGFPEGMAPSTVNDSMREIMAALAKWYSDSDGTLTSGGSSNAYTLTTNSTHAALADMPLVVFRANHTNTGAATLAVDGLAAKSLKKLHDQDLESGDIEEDQIVVCVYNATDDTYEVVSNVPSSSSSQNFHYPVAVSDETTALTTGTAKVTFRMPAAVTLTEVRASLTTASSSGVVTVDINEGGTTILSTKLTIDANEKTSTSAATAAVISDTSLADDAEITIDIDGAGTGAAGLKIYLIGTLT